MIMATIAENLTLLESTKANIKQAIQNKGVTVTDTDTFASYADKISSITSGGGQEFDFTVLGYNQEECKDANNIANAAINLGDFTQSQITEAIAYGKELYDGNYSITYDNVDKDKLLFYPKLELPYVYNDSKVLYIPNVEYRASGVTPNNAYTNQLLYKVGSINAVFTNSNYSVGFFTDCYSLREVGDINITGKAISYNNFFNNCYTLRKIGNMNTTGSTTLEGMFYNCTSLTSIPQLDTSNGTNFSSMFYGCTSLTSIPQLDTSKGINLGSMFSYCSSLTSIPQLDTSKGTKLNFMFNSCKALTSVPQLDTSNGTNFNGMFSDCSNLKRIEGISFKSLNKTVGSFYLTGYDYMNQLRYALIKDIGTCTGMTRIDLVNWSKWGVNDETNTDARQSLVDSLLTYSFDRATAGYSACTISLNSNTKALLTEDEIAQITSKGYTIA